MRKGSTRTAGHGGVRRWTSEEAREALGELARSGMSTARFARTKGVSSQRIVYWRKRLGGTTIEPIAFVSVPLESAAPTGASPSGTGIEIAAHGVVLRAREDIAIERLARIVEVVACGGRRC